MNTNATATRTLRTPALSSLMMAAGLAMAGFAQAQTSNSTSLPPTYNRVIAFGDSLSDTGNFAAATANTVPDPRHYFNGRFSNGPVAVEYLASGLGVGLQNYAWGGAQTGLFNGAATAAGAPPALINTGMLSQLASFQSSLGGGSADAQSLYFLWGGANDIKYLGPTGAVVTQAVQNLSGAVSTLYDLGARNFLLGGLPDLGGTPDGIASGFSGALHQLSLSFNQGLGQALNQLRASKPDIQISYFDAMATQQDLVDHASQYGLSNLTQACFSGGASIAGNNTGPGGSDGTTTCATPASYMYWDGVHPTEVTHSVLGQGLLAAVPEPETMLLMGLGLLAVLGLSRRRGA